MEIPLFLLIPGILAALMLIAALAALLLRRLLMPAPLTKGKLPPSGAGPWQRFRGLSTLHGFTSWNGTPQPDFEDASQAGLQPQVLAQPGLASTITRPGAVLPNTEWPTSQHALAYQQGFYSPATPGQGEAPGFFMGTPQQAGRWGNSQTFASLNRHSDPGSFGIRGNTGKFKRNTLRPLT